MNQSLKDFLADLVTRDQWSATVLQRIFSAPAGEWIPLCSLIDGLEDAIGVYVELGEESCRAVVGTMLSHPFSPDNAYLVIFYDDTELYSTMAIVTSYYLKILGVNFKS